MPRLKCAPRLSGSSARAFRNTSTASSNSPLLASAEPRFVYARAYFGSSATAFRSAAMPWGKSARSSSATPSQLWASAESGATFTACCSLSSARAFSPRSRYATPSATLTFGSSGFFFERLLHPRQRIGGGLGLRLHVRRPARERGSSATRARGRQSSGAHRSGSIAAGERTHRRRELQRTSDCLLAPRRADVHAQAAKRRVRASELASDAREQSEVEPNSHGSACRQQGLRRVAESLDRLRKTDREYLVRGA